MDMKSINGLNIFRLYSEEGVRYIKILGYFYDAECSIDVPGENWRHVEFCWYEVPLAEYLAADENQISEWESEHKQYITDMTEDDALESFEAYDAKPLDWSKVESAPDGIYY